jgi:hypothetical protein
MGPEAEEAAALAAFDGAAGFVEVAGFVEAAGVAGAVGAGAFCAMANAMPEDKRIEDKKCFIVRVGSVEILMGVYQGGLESMGSRLAVDELPEPLCVFMQ